MEAIGCEYSLVHDAAGLRNASKIVLPGVGHFGQMMRALDQMEVRDALKEQIAEGMPFLGICLGLQALFDGSEEAPEERGLGIFEGIVQRFPAHARVPHMGWDELQFRGESKLLRRPQAGKADEAVCPTDAHQVLVAQAASPFVYFAHSYYAPEGEYASAVCTYEVPFTAALEVGNVYGVQFHPEKSGAVGQAIVRNFVAC
jgi:imidazoleglycerol phosphate synthase glutamine amidotransferase subunit HisH